MSDGETRRSRRSLHGDTDGASTVEFVGPGSVVSSRYELVREVGRGAMGVIYEARDRKLEGLRVAIKVLPPELAGNDRAKKRLRREALAAIKLTHTNILRLNDFDEDGATAYLVMEFLDGVTLDDALAATDDERLPLDEVREVATQVCAALAYAHDNGVIHRDIKPSNLMYHHDAGRRVVKVTDFGVAYQVKDSLTRLTGQLSAGTLHYIAPEQVRNEQPDARSDQYSLAATLYELLNGNPPLSGPALSTMILTVTPKPIPGIPDDANASLLRALAKCPDDRFPSILEFGAAFGGRVPAPLLPVPDDVAPAAAPPAESVDGPCPVGWGEAFGWLFVWFVVNGLVYERTFAFLRYGASEWISNRGLFWLVLMAASLVGFIGTGVLVHRAASLDGRPTNAKGGSPAWK